MVLLHLLHRLAPSHAWRLAVAHFDHQIRPESPTDAQLVRQSAETLGIPFFLDSGNVPARARDTSESLEMAARQMRHEFLARTARQLGIPSIALAHHAGDQMELFFLRLFRGAGGEGLGGMKWISPSPVEPTLRLIRPFLNIPKTELAAFARQENIPYAEDATNASLDLPRNRIRHELIPLLEKDYQPALGRTLSRLMEITGADAAFARETATQWLESTDKPPFDQLPLAVQRQCLALQFHALSLPVDFDHLEHLRTHPQTPITLAGGIQIERAPSGLLSIKPPESLEFQADATTVSTAAPGEIRFGRLTIRWHPIHEPGSGFDRNPGMEYFDSDKVGEPVVVRHWKPGDRFQPIGTQNPVKLQDLFVNLKIPVEERRRRVVAVAASGAIFWVEGLRIAQFARLTQETTRRLRWTWQPQDRQV
jgi:tRNA(Ile)-lysidine synthase